MADFGPQYCETPDLITGAFPVEPANAISSGVIVLFGIAALVLVARRTPRAIELYALCALLVVNGTGSILWHGLRTRWALALDVTPALIFLLFVALIWARRVAPLWQLAAAGVGLAALSFALRSIDLGLRLPGRWGAMAPLVVAAAIWLVVRSYAVSKLAASYGAAALVSASAALAFRTIDTGVCGTIPLGTHFLWHIFLSAAAFLSIMAVVTLMTIRSQSVADTPAVKPAQ